MKSIQFEVVGVQRDSNEGRSVKVTLSLQSPDTIYDNQAFVHVLPEEAKDLKFGDIYTLVPTSAIIKAAYKPSKRCSAILGSHSDAPTCQKQVVGDGWFCEEHLQED